MLYMDIEIFAAQNVARVVPPFRRSESRYDPLENKVTIIKNVFGFAPGLYCMHRLTLNITSQS